MNRNILLSGLLAIGTMFSGETRKTKQGKQVSKVVNQQNAARSQRLTRVEYGMRPRESVHARDVARRSKQTISYKLKNRRSK